MKRNLKLLIVLAIILINIPVNAEIICEKEEKKRLKALAEKVEFTYDYEQKEATGDNGRVSMETIFTITATNLNHDIKVTIMEDYYMDKYREWKSIDGTGTASLTGFLPGERVIVTMYGFVPNGCSAVEVYKKYIKLPYYNAFSEDARCEEYPDFKYCVDLVNGPIRESVFETEFQRYINNLNKEKEDEEPENKLDVLTIIIIGVASIAVITTIGVIIYKRKKKYSL